MRAGIDLLSPSESGGSGGTPSEILMMGRMMGNRFRTCHEALFHGKLLLPPPRQENGPKYLIFRVFSCLRLQCPPFISPFSPARDVCFAGRARSVGRGVHVRDKADRGGGFAAGGRGHFYVFVCLLGKFLAGSNESGSTVGAPIQHVVRRTCCRSIETAGCRERFPGMPNGFPFHFRDRCFVR